MSLSSAAKIVLRARRNKIAWSSWWCILSDSIFRRVRFYKNSLQGEQAQVLPQTTMPIIQSRPLHHLCSYPPLHSPSCHSTSKYPAASQPRALLLLRKGAQSGQENDIPQTRLPLERKLLGKSCPRSYQERRGGDHLARVSIAKASIDERGELTGLGCLCTDGVITVALPYRTQRRDFLMETLRSQMTWKAAVVE